MVLLTWLVCFIILLFIEMAIDYSYNGDVPDTVIKLLQIVWIIVILFAAIAVTSALVGLWEVLSG